jgi:hypothetical protein
MGHVFRADLEHCSRCGGPMRWVEAATSAEAIARLLAKHGLALGPRPPLACRPSLRANCALRSRTRPAEPARRDDPGRAP